MIIIIMLYGEDVRMTTSTKPVKIVSLENYIVIFALVNVFSLCVSCSLIWCVAVRGSCPWPTPSTWEAVRLGCSCVATSLTGVLLC